MIHYKKYIIVANWKMLLDFQQSINFCKENYEKLEKLSKDHEIILAPSFVAICEIKKILEKMKITFSSQNCSQFNEGAYTGEISAKMLKEIGCDFCIVGHQERRKYFKETDEIISEKIKRLLEVNITPILCIGEQEKCSIESVKSIIKEQLQYAQKLEKHSNFYIAYEPAWAIGGNNAPTVEHVYEIFAYIRDYLKNHTIKVLYGGSVDEYTIQSIKAVENLDGFLMGRASCNFDTFEKILANLK